jgi:beta-xylosidase
LRRELKDIHLRDPFVLYDGDRYYLYGTRGPTVWTEADGFDCYVSDDLVSWSGPHEIFHRDTGFWADRCYWAPECYRFGDAYYLFASFGAGDGSLAVQVLRGDDPAGPFRLHSDGPVTPEDQQCLDGTFYVDEGGTPHLVFSRSFREAAEGEMCVVRLARDLRTADGDVRVLFRAAEAPWVTPFPFAKQFGIDGDAYLSDGPFLHTTRSGGLLMLWSSFGPSGYAVGVARSSNGDIQGPWTHDAQPLFADDGGHGMVFVSREGALLMAVHRPNTGGEERPVLVELRETDDGLVVRPPGGGADGAQETANETGRL